MLKIIKFISLGLALSFQAQAVTCYMTMVKASCWNNYNLTVKVIDATTQKEITTVQVVKNSSWIRSEFPCKPGLTLALEASFSPVFWSSDEGKLFKATRFWKLPDTVTPDITGWNVTVCFPQWFAEVPLPPEATGKCECDISNIPKLKPGKQ